MQKAEETTGPTADEADDRMSPRRLWRGLACTRQSTIVNRKSIDGIPAKTDAEMKPRLSAAKYPEKFAGKYLQKCPELCARLRRHLYLHLYL